MSRFVSLFGCCKTGSASACIQLWATEAPHQRAQTLEHAQVATSACMEEFPGKTALYTVTKIGSQMCSTGGAELVMLTVQVDWPCAEVEPWVQRRAPGK